MGGGDAVSVQAQGRENDRGGKEEGEAVKMGGVGGGVERYVNPSGPSKAIVGLWLAAGGVLWGPGPDDSVPGDYGVPLCFSSTFLRNRIAPERPRASHMTTKARTDNSTRPASTASRYSRGSPLSEAKASTVYRTR